MASRVCFVIMPFSATDTCTESEWTQIFEEVIRPTIESAGLDYECRRSDATRGNIVRSIIENLNDAWVVLADLTDQNPNVFYELGVRHALNNRTILIAQDRKFIPFDLRPYANHVYDWRSTGGTAALAKTLHTLLREIDTSPDRSDNPVSDFLGTRNSAGNANSGISLRDASVVQLDSVAGPLQDVDLVNELIRARNHSLSPADWRGIVQRTRAHYSREWEQLSQRLNSEYEMPSEVNRTDTYATCLPIIEQFAVDITQIEATALALAQADDRQGLDDLLGVIGDWISMSSRIRAGRSLRPVTGAPALMAFSLLLNLGAKIMDGRNFDLMTWLLTTKIESKTSNDRLQFASIYERQKLFFSDAMLGRADLSVQYVAQESWKHSAVRGFFAEVEPDYLSGLAQFLFVVDLVSSARGAGLIYPGFKLVRDASKSITALIDLLRAKPQAVSSLATAAGEDAAAFRAAFPDRVRELNQAQLGGDYFFSVFWDGVPTTLD